MEFPARLLLLSLALHLVPLACKGPTPEGVEFSKRYPEPTEFIVKANEGKKQTLRRKAWFAARHKAHPDDDWRAIELRNGLDQLAKRNVLAFETNLANPWVERGSNNQAGRMHVTQYSTDGQWLYAGSSRGGLWKGMPDGSNWTPIGDNVYGGTHWLGLIPGDNPGDPDVLLSSTQGGTVLVSRDEGRTWSAPGGLQSWSVDRVRRVLVSSDGNFKPFVLRRSSTGGKYHLKRSDDGMHSFSSVYDLGQFGGDVWMSRTDAGALYLLTETGIQKSPDYGDNWIAMGPLPEIAEEGELVGCEAGAPRLWAALQVGAVDRLYRSDDEGASWTYLADMSDYWSRLTASTTDVNTFAWGGVEVHVTRNAGATFDVVNPWYEYYDDPMNKLHADIMGFNVLEDPNGIETWFVNTDGGVYSSTNKLLTVENLSLSGLRVSQYYSTHTSNVNPDHVVAGAQDQGYQRADTPAVAGTVLEFDQLTSGDYGHISSGDGAHDFLFMTYPGFVLIQRNENSPDLHSEDFPPAETNAWLPPVVADPSDRRDFYFCASRIWRYDFVGANNWTPSLWSAYDFSAVSGNYASALCFSPAQPNLAYAATDDGGLFFSIDGGLNWAPSATTGPPAHYFYGTALLASAASPGTVFAGGSGYSNPGIYRSTNGGISYEPFDQGLPATLVYCLGEAPDGSGKVFCGTETAAYRRDPGASEWVDITGNQAPVTTYWSVEALSAENTMRFGTYGRGIWDYRIDPVRAPVPAPGVAPRDVEVTLTNR